MDFMQSREDGKHMNLNELYDSYIFDLIESQFRILRNKERQEELSNNENIIDNFDSL